MTRRVYYWDAQNMKKRQACQEAMLNLRAARESIDPALLDAARQAIADGLERARQAAERPTKDGMVPVDREKNIGIVMQFLEMKRDNQAFLGRVKEILAEP